MSWHGLCYNGLDHWVRWFGPQAGVVHIGGRLGRQLIGWVGMMGTWCRHAWDSLAQG